MKTQINEIRKGESNDKELLRELTDANNKIFMLEKELKEK